MPSGTVTPSAKFTGGVITSPITGPLGGSIGFLPDGSDDDVVIKISTANGTVFQVVDESNFVFIEAAGGFETALAAPAGGNLFLTSAAGATRIAVSAGGNLGFFGQAPAAQPAAPVTLGDVIAALQTLGLVAT